ncbi:MAG: hypothetical protein ACYDAY_11520 [Candidatus Dormibacteria bacterium]
MALPSPTFGSSPGAPNPFQIAADRLAAATVERDDPVAFWRARGVEFWPHQQNILTAVATSRRTAVASCNSIGKDFSAAHLVGWFVATRHHPLVITTAPTDRQVRHVLWGELRRLASKLGDLPTPGVQEWKGRDGELIAVGFKAKDAEPERFQGYHAENVLIIVDEASGVDEKVYSGIESAMASGNARLLLISNPTRSSGALFDAFHRRREAYRCIQIGAEDTPNFQGAGVVAPYLITPEWADEVALDAGKDSDYYGVKVLGRFPSDDPAALVPLHLAQAALERELVPCDGPKEIGVDVARFGDDDSVFVARDGPNVPRIDVVHGHDTVEVANKTRDIVVELGCVAAKVDDIGVGAGVVDNLKRILPDGVKLTGINVGEAAGDSERFANKRAEYWWGLRERFHQGDINLGGLQPRLAARLIAEVTGVRYFTTPAGKIQIEAKEKFKERLGRSPDLGDALMLAFSKPPRKHALDYTRQLKAELAERAAHEAREGG